MATSASDIGAAASNYTGNSELGGGSLGFGKLDVNPIMDLAKYTMLYNKSEYDQRQKNADEKITEIAAITSFDPNTAIEKDRDQAKNIYNDLVAKATEYSRKSPGSSEEKVSQYWEYKKQIADAQKSINSIKGRAIAYNARREAIKSNLNYSDAQKTQKLAQLEKDAATDINTPIAIEDKFNEGIPEIAVATPRKITASSILDNDNISHEIEVVTSSDLLRQSQAEATGLESILSGSNKDFFAGSENPYKVFHDSAEAYNSAISNPRYQTKDASGNTVIDYVAIKKDNPLVSRSNDLVDQYNIWAEKMKAQAIAGVFTDRLGKTYKSIEGVSPDDFFTIDKAKPLTGDQIVMLEKWRKSPLIKTDEKLVHTGSADQKLNTQLDYKASVYSTGVTARTADKNRIESARQFNESKGDPTTNDNTSGNAFDEIGGTEDIKMDNGGKISNGYVLNKDGSGFTGKVSTPAKNLPASLKLALASSKLNVSEDEKVDLVVKDGQIISVADNTGQPISRQAMENAQKKFDTEQKGQQRTMWGRVTNKPAEPSKTESAEERANRILNGGK